MPCDTALYCGRTRVQPSQHGNEARASDVAAPHPSSLTCVVACLWYWIAQNHSVSFAKGTMELVNIHNRPSRGSPSPPLVLSPLPHLMCALLYTANKKSNECISARMMDGAQDFRRLPQPSEAQRRHESRKTAFVTHATDRTGHYAGTTSSSGTAP